MTSNLFSCFSPCALFGEPRPVGRATIDQVASSPAKVSVCVGPSIEEAQQHFRETSLSSLMKLQSNEELNVSPRALFIWRALLV